MLEPEFRAVRIVGNSRRYSASLFSTRKREGLGVGTLLTLRSEKEAQIERDMKLMEVKSVAELTRDCLSWR